MLLKLCGTSWNVRAGHEVASYDDTVRTSSSKGH